jgi:nucleoside-diphosphate-sugar epimerase
VKHVLVLGATGLVGLAAVRHFAAQPGCRVTAVSRRRSPQWPEGIAHLSLDLDDAAATAAAFGAMESVTHVVYAAVQEQADLVAGWTDAEHVARNGRMLANVLAPLTRVATGLRHVAALQGPKAYGVHVRALPVPSREGRDERRDVPNFYWRQQDELIECQRGQAWSWTVFRPVMVVGESVGGSMNLVATLGVYAALMRELGSELPYPGALGLIKQPSDVDLIARAIDWAGEHDAAANQVFNIDNGEVFGFETVWPAIAEALGMGAGRAARVAAGRVPARPGRGLGPDPRPSRPALAGTRVLPRQLADAGGLLDGRRPERAGPAGAGLQRQAAPGRLPRHARQRDDVSQMVRTLSAAPAASFPWRLPWPALTIRPPNCKTSRSCAASATTSRS